MASAQAHLNEAKHHHQAGRLELARGSYLLALDTEPAEMGIVSQIGQSLHALGFFDEAERAFRAAADRWPADANARYNLAAHYSLQQRWDLATQRYQETLGLAPEYLDALFGLAVALTRLGRVDEAVAAYERILALDPDNSEGHKRLASVLLSVDRYDEAIDHLGYLVDIGPDEIDIRVALRCALAATGRYDEHLRVLRDGLERPMRKPQSNNHFVLDVFLNPAISIADETQILSGIFSDIPGSTAFHGAAKKPDGGRMTIGYFSGYLHFPNYMAFLDGILNAHNRSRYAVRVYSDSHETSTQDHVRATKNLSNEQACDLMRADGVDILVDLNGFAIAERLGLLAMKPSPVVASWFNCFSSIGLPSMDYLIGDEIVSPAEEDSLYPETIQRLPGCYLVRNIVEDAPAVASVPPMEKNGYPTFGVTAAKQKVSAGSIAIWSELLRNVPESRLIMRNGDLTRNLAWFYAREFRKHGIDTDRIEFQGGAEHSEFLRTYDRIDVVLDSFPWNGGTTTFEALWQGVPVVTFRGNRWVSRVAATIVNAVGHPEWFGGNTDDYIEIAASLVRDAGRLRAIRAGLREEMASSMLCDTQAFTRKLENAYETMARERGIVA